MNNIKATQSKQIQDFFIFQRAQLSIALTSFFILLPLIYLNFHRQKADGQKLTELCEAFLGIRIPCSTFYSRIHSTLITWFPASLMVFSNFRLAVTLQNLIEKRKEAFRDSFEKKIEQNAVSILFFNAWDYKVNDKLEAERLQANAHMKVFTQIKEEILKEKIKNQPRSHFTRLYITRAILITINFIFVIACSASIIVVNVQFSHIEKLILKYIELFQLPEFFKQASNTVPTLILTVCSSLINPVSKFITEKEGYDYQHE